MTDTTERREKNRVLAEWLGLKAKKPIRVMAWQEFGNDCGGMFPTDEVITDEWPPDFFTDEAANALLLEKMPRAQLTHLKDNHHWIAIGDWLMPEGGRFDATSKDRKTAIVEAAYQCALKAKP